MEDLIVVNTVNLKLVNPLGEEVILNDFNLNNLELIMNGNGIPDAKLNKLSNSHKMLVNSILINK